MTTPHSDSDGRTASIEDPTWSVLLIDDDDEDQLITTGMLKKCGLPLHIDRIQDGESGRAALEAGQWDVCLLDYQLGAVDGLEVLQSLPAGVKTPIVMLTSTDSPELDTEAIRRGATDYLSKSDLSPQSLARAIRYAVERRKASEMRSHLENQLRQAQKLEAVGRLSGGIAHDVNNILNVIIANVDLAEDGGFDADEQQNALREIRRVSQRGATLVQKLLAYSRRDQLDMSVIDVVPVLREISDVLPRVLPASVDIGVDLPAGPIPVHANSGALHQILLNLATNSKDAMPSGGRLELLANVRNLDEVFCQSRPGAREGTHVAITVSDTGMGMDATTLEKVFDPFFTTKPEGQGTGLGMAMVFGLTKQMRGYVDVTSAPGVGTSMTVYLPVDDRPVPSGTLPAAQPKKVGTETVLLVEDQPELRRAGKKILERAGYEVTVACDGLDALRLFDEMGRQVDLVLTDIVMPNMSGPELREAVLNRSPHNPPQFLFMSGYSAEDVREKVLSEQMHLLNKPWTLQELLHNVRTVLDADHRSVRPRFRRVTAHQKHNEGGKA